MTERVLRSVGIAIPCLAILSGCASQAPFARDEALRQSEQHFGKNSRWVFAEIASTDRLTDSIQLWINDVDEDGSNLAEVLSVPGAKVSVGGPVPAKTEAVVRNALEQLSGASNRGSEILVIGPIPSRDSLATIAREANVTISFTDF